MCPAYVSVQGANVRLDSPPCTRFAAVRQPNWNLCSEHCLPDGGREVIGVRRDRWAFGEVDGVQPKDRMHVDRASILVLDHLDE